MSYDRVSGYTKAGLHRAQLHEKLAASIELNMIKHHFHHSQTAISPYKVITQR